MKRAAVFFLLLAGCAPNSNQDFQHEGQARCRKLTLELKKIETRDQLQKALPLLQKRFEDLVDLMIEARRFQVDHPEEEMEEAASSLTNEEFADELKRIYRLEGGRDLMEKAEREALIRLDAFEKNLAKQQEALPVK